MRLQKHHNTFIRVLFRHRNGIEHGVKIIRMNCGFISSLMPVYWLFSKGLTYTHRYNKVQCKYLLENTAP
jgi:hypothetical protein